MLTAVERGSSAPPPGRPWLEALEPLGGPGTQARQHRRIARSGEGVEVVEALRGHPLGTREAARGRRCVCRRVEAGDEAPCLAQPRRVEAPPQGKCDVRLLPFSETAIRLGSERVANVVALSALVAIGDICSRETLEQTIRTGTPAKFLDLNIDAMQEGFAMADSRAALA